MDDPGRGEGGGGLYWGETNCGPLSSVNANVLQERSTGHTPVTSEEGEHGLRVSVEVILKCVYLYVVVCQRVDEEIKFRKYKIS